MKERLDDAPGARPLYAQLYDILVKKLENGEYEKQDILPTESQFQELFGISRITARKALEKLTEDGYVKRARGIGTIVLRNSKNPEVTIETSFEGLPTKNIERKIILLEKVPSSKRVAKALKIEEGKEITYIKRILKSDGLPILIHEIYLSPKLEILMDKETLKASFYQVLENNGYSMDSYEERVRAKAPTPEEAKLLMLEESSPLLVRERIGYLSDGSVMEYSESKHIDKYYNYLIKVK